MSTHCDLALVCLFPFSTAVDCGNLPNPANGQVTTTGTTFGQNATYSCNTGYNLMGDSTRTCQATGNWSGSAPTCERMFLLSEHHLSITYMIYLSFLQLWTVGLCLIQPMGKLLPQEQHLDKMPPTVVTQATT